MSDTPYPTGAGLTGTGVTGAGVVGEGMGTPGATGAGLGAGAGTQAGIGATGSTNADIERRDTQPGGGGHRLACLFETRAQAERAADDLVAAGIERSRFDIVDQAADSSVGGPATPAASDTSASGGGLWESIKNLFSGDDDTDAYYEGVHRGHVLLTVRTANEAESERIATILEQHDPLDLDAREHEWREAGWTGRSQAGDMGDAATMGTSGAAYAATKPSPTRAATGAPAMAGRAEAGRAGTGGADLARDTATGEQVIPLTAEEVAIGKRRVAGGSVRVRTHIVETPVTETVQLRDERVQVDRRPVDRAVETGSDAFRERSVEMTESREEPVISKTARVTEEVVVRKEAAERSEQVSETARRTEVNVEDDRATGRAGAAGAASTTTPTPKR